MLATHPRTMYFFRFRSWFEIGFGTGVVLSATYWISYILSDKRDAFDVNTSRYVDYIEVRPCAPSGEVARTVFKLAGPASSRRPPPPWLVH